MGKIISYLAVFALGLAFGLGDAPEPETETVFITKWKTRVVEKEPEVIVKEATEACSDIFLLLGDLQEPIEVASQSAGNLESYAHDLGKAAFKDDVMAINRIVLKVRDASDNLGTASIDILQLQDSINEQFLQCQQSVVEEDE